MDENVIQTKPLTQGQITGGPGSNHVPPVVQDVLRSPGQPLDMATRSFMESRFNHDFSQVKVHTDAWAVEAARAVNALAYTVGNHIVFGSGQYKPETHAGKKLLAHEMAHTIQQNHGISGAQLYSGVVQRQCATPSSRPPCDTIDPTPPAPSGTDIFFGNGSSALDATDQTRIASFVTSWHNLGSINDIKVHGFGSISGTEAINWRISCARARAVKDELINQGVASARIETLAHCESTLAPTEAGNRRAVLSIVPAPIGRSILQPPSDSSEFSCPRVVSITLSRGNDDFNECQYQTAIINASLEIDPCACDTTGAIPLTVHYTATLDGKSFSNPAGTTEERQASTIGQRFFLREDGTSNDSPTLQHTDLGRLGDPDDTLDESLILLATVGCFGETTSGRVLLTSGSFVQQTITWLVTADSAGVTNADINVTQTPVRLPLPLRPMSSPYPAFPGTPRDTRCSCHPVTGQHIGSTCPSTFSAGGGGFGGP